MTENPFFVYRHIRLDTNQPFYIGIGKKPKKFNGYRTEYKRAHNTSHRNVIWKNIVAKTNYKVEIIFESDSLEEVQEKEIEFISLYKPRWEGGTLVNLTSGGEFNPQEVCRYRVKFKHTDESRRKISEAGKGRKASDETRKSLSSIRKENDSAKHLIGNIEYLEKAKRTRRDNLSKVKDLQTGIIYESLPDACEILGLYLPTQHSRIRRNLGVKRFEYLEPEKVRKRKSKSNQS